MFNVLMISHNTNYMFCARLKRFELKILTKVCLALQGWLRLVDLLLLLLLYILVYVYTTIFILFPHFMSKQGLVHLRNHTVVFDFLLVKLVVLRFISFTKYGKVLTYFFNSWGFSFFVFIVYVRTHLVLISTCLRFFEVCHLSVLIDSRGNCPLSFMH